MIRSSFALLFLVALGLLAPRPAQAETYNTCAGFVTSLPAVINTQGNWCFKKDLATAITSGNAITINVNNVTIDCNNFKLGGLAAGAGTTADGIVAVGRQNETVRNCNIRGFYHGVNFNTGGGGHVVEDNRFDGNTFISIFVEGDGSEVQRNRAFDTGSSTEVSTFNAIGISTLGSVDVLNNAVTGVVAVSGGGGNAYGIYSTGNSGSSINDNRIRNVLKDGAGVEYGIFEGSSARVSMRGNDLTGDGSVGSIGMSCIDAVAFATENMLNGYETAILNCGAAIKYKGNDIIN